MFYSSKKPNIFSDLFIIKYLSNLDFVLYWYTKTKKSKYKMINSDYVLPFQVIGFFNFPCISLFSASFYP